MSSTDSSRSLTRPLAIIVAAGALLWLLFFDSHSLLNRIKWYGEYRSLSTQNEHLELEIERLESELEKGLSDDAVEKIAREDYGMRRPDETVHPVAPPSN